MASRVTRDHHRWTRDITSPQDTTIDVGGDLIVDVGGGQFIIQDNTSGDPDLTIRSTGSHSVGGSLLLYKDRDGSGGTANNDNDIPGTIYWYGYNDAGTPELKIFGQMATTILMQVTLVKVGK